MEIFIAWNEVHRNVYITDYDRKAQKQILSYMTLTLSDMGNSNLTNVFIKCRSN